MNELIKTLKGMTVSRVLGKTFGEYLVKKTSKSRYCIYCVKTGELKDVIVGAKNVALKILSI